MSVFEVRYQDSPVDPTRDAVFERVSLWCDGDTYLGLFAGLLDGLTINVLAPDRGDDSSAGFHNAMVAVLAERVEEHVANGGRPHWQLDVPLWHLDLAAVLAMEETVPQTRFEYPAVVHTFVASPAGLEVKRPRPRAVPYPTTQRGPRSPRSIP